MTAMLGKKGRRGWVGLGWIASGRVGSVGCKILGIYVRCVFMVPKLCCVVRRIRVCVPWQKVLSGRGTPSSREGGGGGGGM